MLLYYSPFTKRIWSNTSKYDLENNSERVVLSFLVPPHVYLTRDRNFNLVGHRFAITGGIGKI